MPKPKYRLSPAAGSVWDRISRTVGVLAGNGVTLYGVLAWGWNKNAVILLFILEGLVYLGEDAVRVACAPNRPALKGVYVFEFVFILFFGFFALLVFGPYESLEAAIGDGFARVGRLCIEVRIALLVILASHLYHLGRELAASGVIGRRPRQALHLHGGPWALLLFAACMLAPLVARSGPNPMGGLAALVGLKIAGELLAVWLAGPSRSGGRAPGRAAPRDS
jgi:hypothetical protein